MEATARRFTLRRALTVWAFLCVLGWLVLGGMAESAEAECRASNGFLCFDPGAALVLVAIAAAGAWLLGAVVIAIVWKIRRLARSRP